MKTKLANKAECSLMIVEPTATLRQLVSEVVKELGYEKTFLAASCKEAVHVLEVEEIDWIITSIQPEDSVCGLHLLRLIGETPRLRGTQVSFLVDEKERVYLSQSFELGLMSWHNKVYVKDSMIAEFQDFLTALEVNDWNITLIAAESLRSYLAEVNRLKSRLVLEKNLSSLYPGAPKLMMAMAEAEYLNGNTAKADSLVQQIQMINPKFAAVCKHLRNKYKSSTSEPDAKPENVFNLKSAIIIDPDTNILGYIKETLQEIGVKGVEIFEDGLAATECLATGIHKPDLVIMEWRLPGIHGAAALQRIRKLISPECLVIIISSLLKRDDKPLLTEMCVDDVLEKPFERPDLLQTLARAAQQNRVPTEIACLEKKIRRMMASGKVDEAMPLIAQVQTDPTAPGQIQKTLEAETLYAKNRFSEALTLCIETLKHSEGNSLSLLDLAGRCMLKLKEYEKAAAIFQKANEISPLNIDRLLNTAEVNMHLERNDAASEAIECAAAIDQTNPAVSQMVGQQAIENGDLELAKESLEDLPSLSRVAAYINNRAVSLILSKRYEEGISLYQKTLSAIPKTDSHTNAVLTYNLGLAYARTNSMKNASDTLKSELFDLPGDLSKKAHHLLTRVQQCLERGTSLNLDATADFAAPHSQPSVPKFDWDEIMANSKIKAGEFGCYLSFRDIERQSTDPLIDVSKLPHFMPRKGMTRSEKSP